MDSLVSRPELFDPRAGSEAIRLSSIEAGPGPVEPPRTNYFSIYRNDHSGGEFWADAGRYRLAPNSLLFFTPYQYIRLVPDSPLRAKVIHFHANFLCVETFHAETGCAGTLFNDPYQSPLLALDAESGRATSEWFDRMEREQARRDHAFDEMLLAQLKILLILAARWKAHTLVECGADESPPRHPILAPLKELIETHYTTLHAPSDYAKRLHMSPKTLARIVREQLGKSLSELIRERVLTHAKWQFLHTLKPVKEVARELGYDDELYFSRMFKKATGFSPTFFRKFETEIRGGSNLSMDSSPAPIRTDLTATDNRPH